MSATEARARDCRHLIGGKWVDAAGGGTFDDLDPYTGDVVARVAAGDRSAAAGAIEAAHAAFAEWSQAGPGRRQALFLKAADLLESRRDEVVGWLAKETGCSFGFGMFQMGFVPGLFRQAAGAAYAPLGQSFRPTCRARSRWACESRSAWSARSRRGTRRSSSRPVRSRHRSSSGTPSS